jgi:hypothetical protein
MAGEARWPLTREQQELLVMLSSMIERFGAERFLESKLVRADKSDFPDKWEGTLQSVHQVLYRLCWHAYIDPEIVVEDLRPPVEDAYVMLRSTEIEIASCAAGTVTFHVNLIGNDDVAGLLAHSIGEAFLELSPDLAPGEPFRSTTHEADEREASVAAVFLGLGVPAANAAMYRRHASEIRGRDEHSGTKFATAGGLDIADITLLLAIQDILRDEVQPALSTLHASQRDWVEQWKDVLDPHEDELREMLGLDKKREPRTLTRSAAPRVAPAHDEKARKRFNVGEDTMRVVRRSYFMLVPAVFVGAMLGAGVGRLLGLEPSSGLGLAAGAGVLACVVFGFWRWCQPYYRCTHGACSGLVGASDPTCRHCGGAITKTVTQKELEAIWAKWRAEEEERDEQIDPSEFAGDPDAGEFREDYAKKRRAARRERGA